MLTTSLQNEPCNTTAPPLAKSGWLGRLELTFTSQGGRTVIDARRQQGPLTIQRPFYPEGAPCHLYLLHPPGGVVGGDRLELDLTLTADSHVLMTMPGATKFYRSHQHQATLAQSFKLKENSILEWLPQDNILFAQANAAIQTQFELAPSSKLLGWESLCFGRPVMQEAFTEGELFSRLSLKTTSLYGLNEVLHIKQGDLSALGGYAYSATFFAYPANDLLITLARSVLATCPTPAAATCVDDILVARLLTADNQSCQHYLLQLWKTLRPHLLGLPPCPPRIWLT